MDIILCKNNSEPNKINKILSDQYTLSGTLKEQTSITSPIIMIESGNPVGFNYAYIPDFNRYYFISDIVNVSNNLWRINLKVDVLESFKSDILSSSAILSDSEVIGSDRYMSGDVWKSKVKDTTNIIKFPSGLLEEGEFILITAGG